MTHKIFLFAQPGSIGAPQKLPEIEVRVKEFVAAWRSVVPKKSWWQKRSRNLHQVTDFLISCLDELICVVDELLDSGPDKKATVLWAIAEIYNLVIQDALPIWLKPFAGNIEAYIIYVLISVAIDWIVEKYRNGSWSKGGQDGKETQV